LIPWIGYILGGTVAWLFGLPFKQIKTVSIETGIQNVGIGFIVVISNFPSPEADLAVLPLFAVAFLTNIPFYIVLAIYKTYEKLKYKKTNINEDEANKEITNNNQLEISEK
jgi:predicted Na+-dependent transporter